MSNLPTPVSIPGLSTTPLATPPGNVPANGAGGGGGGGGGPGDPWLPEFRKWLVPLVMGAFGFFVAYLIFFKLVGEGQLKNVSDTTAKQIAESSQAAGKSIADSQNEARNASDAMKQLVLETKNLHAAVTTDLVAASAEVARSLANAQKLSEENAKIDRALKILQEEGKSAQAEKLVELLKLEDANGNITKSLAATALIRPNLHRAKNGGVKYQLLGTKSVQVSGENGKMYWLTDKVPITLTWPGSSRLLLMSATGIVRSKSGSKIVLELDFVDQDGNQLGRANWYAPTETTGWATYSLTGFAEAGPSVTGVRLGAEQNGKQPMDYEFHTESLEVVEWPIDPQ